MISSIAVHNWKVLSACFHDCSTWRLYCPWCAITFCFVSAILLDTMSPLPPPTVYFPQLLVNGYHVWQNECPDLCQTMTNTEIFTTPFPVLWRHKGDVKDTCLMCPVQELRRAQLEVMCTWDRPDHWPASDAVLCWHRWKLSNGSDSKLFLM